MASSYCLVCFFPRWTYYKTTPWVYHIITERVELGLEHPKPDLTNLSINTQIQQESTLSIQRKRKDCQIKKGVEEIWRGEEGRVRVGEPREARVVLSLMMLTSSTIANSSNIAISCASVMCFGTWPTNSFTLSSLCFRGFCPSAINARDKNHTLSPFKICTCNYSLLFCLSLLPTSSPVWQFRRADLSFSVSLSSSTALLLFWVCLSSFSLFSNFCVESSLAEDLYWGNWAISGWQSWIFTDFIIIETGICSPRLAFIYGAATTVVLGLFWPPQP